MKLINRCESFVDSNKKLSELVAQMICMNYAKEFELDELEYISLLLSNKFSFVFNYN